MAKILVLHSYGIVTVPRQRKRRSGTFKDYDFSFVHMDIKHLPKLQTADGERCRRYLYLAIDRCSRWVQLASSVSCLVSSGIMDLPDEVALS